MGLSVAWLGIYQQHKNTLELKRGEKKCFLDSLSIELANIESWAGHYPTKSYEFWWSYPNVQDWKAPFGKVVWTFSHEVVKTGIREGIHKELSPNLVNQLLLLEQSILAFECILDLLKRLAYSNPTVSWTLTQKVLSATSGVATLTQEELSLLMQNFTLNHVLHVVCIGNDDTGESAMEGDNKTTGKTPEVNKAEDKDDLTSQAKITEGEPNETEQGTKEVNTQSTTTFVSLKSLEPEMLGAIEAVIKTSLKEALADNLTEVLTNAVKEGVTGSLLTEKSNSLIRRQNLYTAYKRTQELLREEICSLDGSAKYSPPVWMRIFNIAVWALAAIGAMVIIAAFINIPKISVNTNLTIDELSLIHI